ncbi:MAG TPA: DUF3090 family protein [Acidimicrobiales bacterium]|nr:DUF3090 family protein [Acidimicrobiales bacterium]
MSAPSFDFQAPTGIGVGAIGEPGSRVFYLQVRTDDRVVSFKVEKHQIAQLAAWLVSELSAMERAEDDAPAAILYEPVEPVWTIGPIGVQYDAENDRFIIEASELLQEDAIDEPAIARIRITRAQATGLAVHGMAAVSAGRPPCPFCDLPLSDDHICPRSNGKRPHS